MIPAGFSSIVSGEGKSKDPDVVSTTGSLFELDPPRNAGGGGGTPNGLGAAGNSGSYSPVEGYAGGNAFQNASAQSGSGGGGGAGGVGAAGTNSNGGNGGIGITNDITGTSVYYGGGGGGGKKAITAGTGGSGGGGNGGTYDGSVQATAGTPNTGGGGGGRSPIGGGGSGIVIVRYTA